MFHTCAYHKNIGAGSSPVSLDPCVDDVFGIEGSAIVSSTPSKIFAGLAFGEDLNRASIVTPSLRSIAPPFVRPIISAAAMPANPSLAEWLEAPLDVIAGEGITCEAVHDNVAAKDQYVLLWLARELEPAPPGPVLTIRGTSSTATTANVWSDISLTWDTPLALGRYAVVASECISANALAFRWKFDTQGLRPGGVSQSSIGGRTHQYFARPGKLGVWGTISAQVMPRMQVLSTASSSSHTVFLQVVRIG